MNFLWLTSHPATGGVSPAATATLRKRESNVTVNVVEESIFLTENPTEQLILQNTILFGTKAGHVIKHSWIHYFHNTFVWPLFVHPSRESCNNHTRPSEVIVATIMFEVGFEVLTAVITNITIFWGITPYSPSRVKRRCGGTYRLHLQGRRISRGRNQRENTLLTICFHAVFFCSAYSNTIWRRYIRPKRRLTFNGLHGIMSQRTALFNYV
jgi:hypothetical protein